MRFPFAFALSPLTFPPFPSLSGPCPPTPDPHSYLLPVYNL